MLYHRQAKKRGRKLARMLRDSIAWRDEPLGPILIGTCWWEIVPHEPLDGITELRRGDYAVTIQPSKQLPAVRMFDRCRLSFRGADVWLPLIQRLRLKNAVRLYMAVLATL